LDILPIKYIIQEKTKKSVTSGYEYAIGALEALYDLNITA